MSKKTSLTVGRLVVHSLEQRASEQARRLRAEFARMKAANNALIKKTGSKLYDPRGDMSAPAARPGAEDALAIPSRIGNHLHYRDGRVVDITLRGKQ